MKVSKRAWSICAAGLFAMSVSFAGTAFAYTATTIGGSSIEVASNSHATEESPDIGRIHPDKICCNPLSPGCSPCPW